MKSVSELNAIRDKALNSVEIKTESDGTRIVVGMATCGIAAGAKPVLKAFEEEITKRELTGINITPAGCIGVCRLEPIVEVYRQGEPRVTYVKVDPEMVPKIVSQHIVNGSPVVEHTIGYVENRN